MADLTIRINVDNAEANRRLAETDRNVDAISESSGDASRSVGSLETSLSKVGAVAAGIAALKIGFDGLTKFVGASVESFSQQETALKRLETALRAQGSATPAVIEQYSAMANTFQNTTVFADELITEMQALLVQVGNVMPQDMQAALNAATNLAAGLGIDLRTATMLVGKAFEGETGTLKRYGIVIDESKLKTEGASAVMDAINQKFGGQAQAQLDTYSGKTANLGNKMDDLREKVGGLVVKAIGPLLDLFLKLPEPLQTIILSAGALVVILGPIAFGFASIASAVGPLIPLLSAGLTGSIGLVTGGFTALATFVTGTILPMLTTALPIALRGLAMLLTPPVGLVIAGILAVVAIWRNWDTIVPIVMNVYNAVKTWLVEKFTAIVDSIRAKVEAVTGFFKGMYDMVVGNSYVPDMIAGIEVEFGRLNEVMTVPTQTETGLVNEAFFGMQEEGIAKATTMVDGMAAQFGRLPDIMTIPTIQEAGAVVTEIESMRDRVLSKINELLTQMGGRWATVGQILTDPVKFGTDKVVGLFGDMTSKVLGMVGGPESGLGRLLSAGLGALFGPAGPLIGLATKGLSALAGVVMKGLSWIGGKISGFFKGLFGGGVIGTVVNPARDQWFNQYGNGSMEAVAAELSKNGIDGNQARDMIASVFNAKSMDELTRSTGAIDRLAGRGLVAGGNMDFGGMMAAGGYGTVTRPTAFIAGERGPEQFAFSGAHRSFSGPSIDPRAIAQALADELRRSPIAVRNYMDGREMAWHLVPHIPEVQAALG